MKTVRKLVLEKVSDELLESVIGHAGLREMDAADTDLSGLEASLLARAVTGMEEVDIADTQLTRQQVKEVFTSIFGRHSHSFGCKDDVQCRIKKLDISNNNRFTLEPGLLARAVITLETVWLMTQGNS